MTDSEHDDETTVRRLMELMTTCLRRSAAWVRMAWAG